jgi:hypothetical protein
MADIPSPQQPDLVGAMRLVIVAVMHMGQAMEQNAASSPNTAAASMRRAQDALAKAGMLLDVPEDEAPSSELPPASEPEPDAPPAPVDHSDDPVVAAPEPVSEPIPESPDPQPEPPLAA